MNEVNDLSQEKIGEDFLFRIYDEYYSKLYKYVLFRVGDPDIAEDLVSEIFKKILQKYNTYNPQIAKLSTWLFTVANNTIINYYKKNNYRNVEIDCEKIVDNYQLEEMVFEKELKEKLIQAIMGLDERQRNIIALKFASGLTNREIALMLNLTESNVGTILYRSLQYLRNILKGQGI